MFILAAAIDFYSLIVLVAVILSWVPAARDNALAVAVARVTEPVFERLRAVIPPLGGLDLSPWLLLMGLRFVRGLLH